LPANALSAARKLRRIVFVTIIVNKAVLIGCLSEEKNMNISILKSAAMAGDIGQSVQRSMTRLSKNTLENGQRQSTFLKLIDADARAFEEYQSMLKQLSLPSSRASGGLAQLKK
jgi:hypothetical protein